MKEATVGAEHLRLRTRLDDLAVSLEIERKFTQLDGVLPDVLHTMRTQPAFAFVDDATDGKH